MKLSIELGKNSVLVDETKTYLGSLPEVVGQLDSGWKQVEDIREKTINHLNMYSKWLLSGGILIVLTFVVALIGSYEALADTAFVVGLFYLLFLLSYSFIGINKAEKELVKVTEAVLEKYAVLDYIFQYGVPLDTESGIYFHSKQRKRFFDTLRLVEEKDIEIYRLKYPYELTIENEKEFTIEREIVIKYNDKYYLFARKGSGENLYAYQFIEYP